MNLGVKMSQEEEMDQVLSLCERHLKDIEGVVIPVRVSENMKFLNSDRIAELNRDRRDLSEKLENAREQFNEARAKGYATHPNIVVSIQNVFYFTMDLKDKYRIYLKWS